jgi:glucose-1-phosphate cytidylyltransferase
MKTVILCGGRGTRLGSEELPKALLPIGERPILWHIMNIYAHYGFRDFVLCLGYKGDLIKEYFKKVKNWKISFIDTGLNTNTGGRIKRVEHNIKEDLFFATYGDGLSDINLKNLLTFHLKHKKIATLSIVRPRSTFGIVSIDSHSDLITHFEEKPILDHWINGGFFVFKKEVFKYLKPGDVLETHSFNRLIKDRQALAYKHLGFWECMDTYKDNLRLNEMWRSGKASWITWKGK